MATIDDLMYLEGDEDCGVGISCRRCYRGGAPIAYYRGISSAYLGTDVVLVRTITELIDAGHAHLATCNG